MHAPTRGRRGYALITSMLLVFLFFVIGLAMIGIGGTSRRLSVRRAMSAQALNLAMGAADEGVLNLKSNLYYTGYTNRSFGGGTVSVAVTTSGAYRRVESTAVVTQGGHTATRRVRVVVQPGTVPFSLYQGMAASNDMSLSGTVTVTSSPTAGQGHVHSNGTMTLNGSSVTVNGNLTSSGTMIKENGNPTVSGTNLAGQPTVQFPEVTSDFKNQSLVNGSYTGNVSVSDGRLIEGKINGNLTVGTPLGCQVNGVVYVTGTVTITGPVYGTGTIVTDNPLSVNFSGSYPAGVVNRVGFITTASGTALNLSGTQQFRGLVYAPNGSVSFAGGSSFIIQGSLLARSISIAGNVTVTRDTTYATDPPPVPRGTRVAGWQEL